MHRFDNARRVAGLDAVEDCHEIYRVLATLEFPWDLIESLSFALFRTYAVPSIGSLLHHTGEFTERTQKRYDDTALILGAILEHGADSPTGRAALRRMNRMHHAYDITNDDLRYVLATFVVVPDRWLRDYGWRALTDHERVAVVQHYRQVGQRMGIDDVPQTFPEFERLLDDYEDQHFAFDPGGRAVADATLGLMTTFVPIRWVPAALGRRFAYALMDDHLLAAFRYPEPAGWERALARGGLRLRGRLVRLLPARRTPKYARQSSSIRSYPDGYDVDRLGTFPTTPDGPDGGHG